MPWQKFLGIPCIGLPNTGFVEKPVVSQIAKTFKGVPIVQIARRVKSDNEVQVMKRHILVNEVSLKLSLHQSSNSSNWKNLCTQQYCKVLLRYCFTKSTSFSANLSDAFCERQKSSSIILFSNLNGKAFSDQCPSTCEYFEISPSRGSENIGQCKNSGIFSRGL